MIAFVDRKTKPDPASAVSAATAQNLVADIRRSEGDPAKITTMGPVYDAYTAGKLGRQDFEFVQKQFKDMGTDDGHRIGEEVKKLIAAAKPQIDKSNPLAGVLDQTGAMQTMLYERMVQASVDRMRKEGKDPYVLFDPSNPAWLGKPEIIARYQTDLNESMRGAVQRMRPRTGPPPSPGSLVAPILPDARPSLDQIFKR